MASKRAFTSFLSHSFRKPSFSPQSSSPFYRTLASRPPARPRYPLKHSQRRWESSSASPTKAYTFEEVLQTTNTPDILPC